MFSDTGKQIILLPGKSSNIMFLNTGKQNVLLPDESNKIVFADTGKQNVLLPDESNKIMFLDTEKQERVPTYLLGITDWLRLHIIHISFKSMDLLLISFYCVYLG